MPFPALSCRSGPRSPTVQTFRGENCAFAYNGGDGADVGLFDVARIAPNIVRQFISSGPACTEGETIVVYYDCAKKRAVWLGGSSADMEALTPRYAERWYNELILKDGDIIDGMTFPPGPARYFVQHVEPGFASDYPLEALLAKARSLKWVGQSGTVNSNRMSVDGRNFTLSCGCSLPDQ
ncbi:hypothetical protein [Paracoccus lutimaris]|nr:hypothetical protein [Paracoccus lutimaris]